MNDIYGLKKFKWFKCYFAFRDLIYDVSVFSAKKLIIAMFDYAEFEIIPTNLNKKTMVIFNTFKTVMDKEKELYIENGKKGAEKRWNKTEKDTLKTNHRVSNKRR